MLAKKILVATDLSEASNSALRSGATLSTDPATRVVLLHCFDPTPSVPPLGLPNLKRLEEQLANELQTALLERLESIRDQFLPVDRTDVLVRRHPSPAGGICEVAEAEGCDLVVVGTHGRTGLTHILLGSVAEQVVRRAPCAVLVCRAR